MAPAKHLSDFPSGQELVKLIDDVRPKPLATRILKLATTLANEAAGSRDPADDTRPSNDRDVAAAEAVIQNIQFVTPRGKFDLGIFEDVLLMSSKQAKQQSIQVPWGAVEHVVVMDAAPDDRDKDKGLLVLVLKRSQPVTHGKVALGTLAMKVETDRVVSLPSPSACSHVAVDGQLTGPLPVVMCQLLGAFMPECDDSTWVGADQDLFHSSTSQPYLQANLKAQPGWLVPLRGAWLYLGKPTQYIRHTQVLYCELHRAGGGSSTFDLSLHCHGSTLELGQIDSQELGAVQRYIAAERIQVDAPRQPDLPDVTSKQQQQQSAGRGGGPGDEDGGAELDEDEEEDDSDYDPTASDAEDQPALKKQRMQQEDSAGGAGTLDEDMEADSEGEEEVGEEEEDEEEDEDEDDEEGSESVSLVDED